MDTMTCATLCEQVQATDWLIVLNHTMVAWLWLVMLSKPSQFVSHGLWLCIVLQLSNYILFSKLNMVKPTMPTENGTNQYSNHSRTKAVRFTNGLSLLLHNYFMLQSPDPKDLFSPHCQLPGQTFPSCWAYCSAHSASPIYRLALWQHLTTMQCIDHCSC